MPIKTKQWDDPREPDDGHRLLVSRYRPRGLAKADETWDAWEPDLGPTKALHAAAYGKGGVPLNWPVYRNRYRLEMQKQRAKVADLARRSGAGETITLLCSSACTRESRCHRSLLKELIDAATGSGRSSESLPPAVSSPPARSPD
jgi:uncharacterized protein YeaO (DUF488 family)